MSDDKKTVDCNIEEESKDLDYRVKKRHGVGFFVTLIMVILILIGGISAAYVLLPDYLGKPFKPQDETKIPFNVEAGWSTEKIASELESKQLIEDSFDFELFSKLKSYDGEYKQGSYVLSSSMDMEELAEILKSGISVAKRVTIPEGHTVDETLEILSNNGFGTVEEFKAAIELGGYDYKFLEGISKNNDKLEGFLFPETYELRQGESPEVIIDTMLKQFNSIFKPSYYRKAEQMNLSVLEVITLASMIEKESSVDSDRALISSVIHNRLKKGMALQIDATVLYAMGEHKDRLLYKDLEIDSPYNTYKIKGLPQGPICSPGEESIKAALNPAKTNYLYYVLSPRGDGSHNFCEDAKQFNEAKKEYLNSMDFD